MREYKIYLFLHFGKPELGEKVGVNIAPRLSNTGG